MDLPIPFEQQMRRMLGEEAFKAFETALDRTAVVALRPNEAKGVTLDAQLKRVPWSSKGYYLPERPPFTFDPLFHAGGYYVQEPSSMFVEQALKVCGKPKCVLDLCASPGGKSTLIRQCLPEDDCLLVSNEPIANRAQILLENITKWGSPAVAVTQNYPADFARLEGMFDLIAVDAPCSGEGMFRKQNPALKEWSPKNVQMCAERQFNIVCDVWPALGEGKYLIYSTCTYNTEENEQNVERICKELGAEVVEVPVNKDWNLMSNLLPNADFPVYRFLPHKTNGEGFFLCVMRKLSSSGNKNLKSKNLFQPVPRTFRDALNLEVQTIKIGDVLCAVPSQFVPMITPLLNKVHVLSVGVPLAENHGHDYRPYHGLAMSTKINMEAFETVGISKSDALQYLRREALTLPKGTARGYVLLMYEKHPLGFVNNLGAHANNLYPSEWKIRSGYTQEYDFDLIRK